MRLRRTTSSTWIGVGLAALGLFWLFQGRPVRGAATLAVALNIVLLLRARNPRYVLFPMMTLALAVVVPTALVTTLDLYLHRRYDATGGYNIWGYRGPIVGDKKPGERRIAMLGGSVAFGYGVRSDETIPFYLEQELSRTRTAGGPVNVVNLGWNSEGAYSFRFTLEDYDYLDPDAVILYSGYNDVQYNNQVFRRQSAVFRSTGYLPILPVIPVATWLHVRDLSTTANGQVVFKPNLADRTAAGAADLALEIQQALERQLSSVAADQQARPGGGGGCEGRWNHYCDSIYTAVRYALDRDRHAIVVTEPYIGGGGSGGDMHISQQGALRAMLTEKFPGEARLHYLNMGGAVNLTDRALCYDGVHLTAAGNALLAKELAPRVEDILAEMDKPPLIAALAPPLERRSAQGSPEARAAMLARQAVDELARGQSRNALEHSAEALRLDRGAGPLWAGALAQAFAGHLSEAETLADEFERLSPSDLFTVKLWAPILRGAIELHRHNPAGALRILEPTVVYERGTYWTRYLRALCFLEMNREWEAEPELRRIIEQPDVDAASPAYVAAQSQLARARARM